MAPAQIGCVLIVEDDALLGLDLADALREASFDVLGPFATIDAAMQAIGMSQPDIAILDIDLHGSMSFPVADALAMANVLLIWLSASSASIVPTNHQLRPFVSKPFDEAKVLRVLGDLLNAS
jgi:DNA-binding response OmpR family regulator